MGSQSPKKSTQISKEKEKSFEIFFQKFQNMDKWAYHPHTKTPQCPHSGNWGIKQQSHKLYNHKTDINPQVYIN